MPSLKQTNLLYRGFAYIKVRPDSRLSTRLFAHGIKKPTAKKTKKAKTIMRDLVAMQAIVAKQKKVPLHCPARPPTPIFDPDAHMHGMQRLGSVFLRAVDSLDVHDKNYAGYSARRDLQWSDEPSSEYGSDPEYAYSRPAKTPAKAGPSELPDELWTEIALRSGDGKAVRKMAKLGHAFAQAAQTHEDNVTPEWETSHEADEAVFQALAEAASIAGLAIAGARDIFDA